MFKKHVVSKDVDLNLLKKCSFCGSTPIINIFQTTGGIFGSTYYRCTIACSKRVENHSCSVMGRSSVRSKSIDIAVELWENRKGQM